MNGNKNTKKLFNSFAVAILLGTTVLTPISTVFADEEVLVNNSSSAEGEEVVDNSSSSAEGEEVVDNSSSSAEGEEVVGNSTSSKDLKTNESVLIEPRLSYNRFKDVFQLYDNGTWFDSILVQTTLYYVNENVKWTIIRSGQKIASGTEPIVRSATNYNMGETWIHPWAKGITIWENDRLDVELSDAHNGIADTRTIYLRGYHNVAPATFSGVNNKTINNGDIFDPMEGVKAVDFRGVDITSSIKVDGSVDSSIQGSYILKYSVTDISGYETIKNRTITVKPEVERPFIEGAMNHTITAGTVFDPMEGVTAWDIVDGDLTDQIVVTADFDSETPGIYYISYSVTNTRGESSFVDTVLTVEKPQVIENTTISALTTTSRTVTGTGEPNGDIRILNGSNVLATGRVGSDGLYSLTITPQPLGNTIKAEIKKNGLSSEASTIVKQAEDDLLAPVLNPFFVDDVFVRGTVGGTARFVAVYAHGVFLRTAAVNADRTFVIYTGDQNLVAGQEIQIAAVTRSGDNGPIIATGPKSSIRVQDRFAAPVINPVHSGDKNINGTIGGTARYVSVYINGQIVQTAVVNANRTYSIDVSNQTLTAGQNIQLAGVTRDGATGPIVAEGPKTTTTVLSRDQLVAPSVNPIFVDDAFVRGTVGGTARFVAVYGKNGQFLRTAAVKSDRSYEIYVGDHNLAAGQTIQVSAVTRENDTGPIVAESPRTSALVQDRFVAPVINPVRVNDAFVNGTVGGTTQYVGLYINGVLSRTAAVNSDRTYTIYVGDRNLVVGQKIEVSGVTRDVGNGSVVGTGPKTETTILNEGHLVGNTTINPFFETEQFATGTGDINGTHVGVYINGELRRVAAINPDKTYSIYMDDLNLIAGDSFEISSLIRTATGLITESGPKTKSTVLTKNIIINRYVLGQDLISGKMSSGTSRIFLNVDGVQVRRGEVDSDGTFRIWAKDVIHSTTQKVELVAIGANGTEIGRFSVTVNAN